MFSKTIIVRQKIYQLFVKIYLTHTKIAKHVIEIFLSYNYTLPFSSERALVLKNCHSLKPCILKIKELFLNLTKLCSFPKTSTCRSNVHPTKIQMNSSVKKRMQKC